MTPHQRRRLPYSSPPHARRISSLAERLSPSTLLLVLGLFLVRPSHAAALQLSISEGGSDPGPTLVLSGLDPGQYAIQTSADLTTWTSVATGPAVNGAFRHQHQRTPGERGMFFRGLQVSADSGPEVVAELDADAVAVGLITPEAGGRLTLTNRSGTRFVFTVAPSNVIETVAISMRAVTEFSVFPAGSSQRSAVVFTPDGFSFHGAGRLEIQFPTDQPALKLSSYAFAGSGKDFHLVPDLVASNRVVIPVTHFSGVGTAIWESLGRAAMVQTFIHDARNRYRAELAGILSREREKALQGGDPLTNVGAELVLRGEAYFREILEPSFPEAGRNCALATFLLREILGLAREAEMLGWPDGPASRFLASRAWETWQCNCLREAFDACANGASSEHRLVRTVLGFARESQLLGGEDILASCGLGTLPDFLDQVAGKKLPCLTEWVGFATYADHGQQTKDCSNPQTSYTCSTTVGAAEQFEVEVDQALVKEIATPFFTQQEVTLTLRGDATTALIEDKDEDQRFDCGAVSSGRWRTSGTASHPVEVRVHFSFLNGALTSFSAAQSTALSANLRTVHSTSKTSCGGIPDPTGTQVSESSLTHDLFAKEISLQHVVLTRASAGEIEGSARGTRTGFLGVPQDFLWTFHLRHQR